MVSSTKVPYVEQPNALLYSNFKSSDNFPSYPTSPVENSKPPSSLPQESHNNPQPAHNPAMQPSNDSAEPEYNNAPTARPAYHPPPADASYNEVKPLAPVIPLLTLDNGITQSGDEQKPPLDPVDNLKYANTGGETVEDSFEYWETPDGSPSHPLAPSVAYFTPPSPHPTLRELPPTNLLNKTISVADPTTLKPSLTSTTASTSKPSYVTTSSTSEQPSPTTTAYNQSTTSAPASATTSSSATLAPIVYSYSASALEEEEQETFKRESAIPGPYIGAAPVFSQGPRVPDIWEMFNAEWGQRVRRRSG